MEDELVVRQVSVDLLAAVMIYKIKTMVINMLHKNQTDLQIIGS